MIEPGPDEPGPFGIAFADVVVEADHIDVDSAIQSGVFGPSWFQQLGVTLPLVAMKDHPDRLPDHTLHMENLQSCIHKRLVERVTGGTHTSTTIIESGRHDKIILPIRAKFGDTGASKVELKCASSLEAPDPRKYNPGNVKQIQISCLSKSLQDGHLPEDLTVHCLIILEDFPGHREGCRFLQIEDIPTNALQTKFTLDGDETRPTSCYNGFGWRKVNLC